MPRARKGAARTRSRRRVLKAARGYWGTKSRHKQQAKVALMRAGRFAYRDRRNRKREFRRLWITRLSAASRNHGLRYSRFIFGLKRAGIVYGFADRGLEGKGHRLWTWHRPGWCADIRGARPG